MPNGNRRFIAALGLGAFLATAVIVASVLNYQAQQAVERDSAAKARSDYASHEPDCVRLVPPGPMVVDCMIKQVQTAHQEKHTEYDLRAQQDMAAWALALMWMGVIGTFMSAAGILLVYRNLVETREIGQNQTRAFVHATEARLYVFLPTDRPGIFMNPRFDHSVVVTLANTGTTPAVDLDAAAKLWVQDTGRPDQPIDLEFDQSGVADAIVNGTPIGLRFKLAHNDFRPPDKNIPKGGIADALRPSEDLGLFGLGAMDWSSDSAKFDPPKSEPAGRGGLSGILATFFDSKYVKCRGEILYSDVFGARFRTEFYFEYLGTPKDGGFQMTPVRGGLKMFEKVPPGTKPKMRSEPGGLSAEAMIAAFETSPTNPELTRDLTIDEEAGEIK